MIGVVKYEDIKREVMRDELINLLFDIHCEKIPSMGEIADYLLDHGVTIKQPTVKEKYATVETVAACRTLRRRRFKDDPDDRLKEFMAKQDMAGAIGREMFQNGLIKFREIEHHTVSIACIPYEETEYKLIGEAKVLREE